MWSFSFQRLFTFSLILGMMVLLGDRPVTVDAQAGNPNAYGSDANAPDNAVFVKGGNVGINTTVPTHRLHVVGDGAQASAVFESAGDREIAGIRLRPGGTPTDETANEVGLDTLPNGGFGIFTYATPGQNGGWRLAVSRTGNVGIGTTSPARPLEVATDTGGATNHLISFLTTADGGKGSLFGVDTTNRVMYWRLNDSGDYGWQFQNGQGTPAMTILNSGKVGIGTTATANSLRVKGNGETLAVEGGDHTYIEFFPDGPQTRKAWLGFGSGNDNNLTIANQIFGANIVLTPNGGDVRVNGTMSASIIQLTGGDLAEPFAIVDAETIQPGMVVAIDPDHPGQMRLATMAYDRTVAGVVSGAGGIEPGVLMYKDGASEDTRPVALSGRVYVYADATNGPIVPGDLLTTANTPGHAMKVTDYERAQGAILGKAMSKLAEGTGLVLVLVTLQ